MISLLVKNNHDAVIACKDENGSIFLQKDRKIDKIVDGEMPKKLRSQKTYISRIGIGYIARASKIRTGSLTSGRIGYYMIEDNLSLTEFNKSDISPSKKSLIKMHWQKNC